MNLSNELKNLRYWFEVWEENPTINSCYFNPDYILKLSVDKYKWSFPKISYIPQKDKLREVFIYNEQDSCLQKIINKILSYNYDTALSKNLFSYRKNVRTSSAVSLLKSAYSQYGVKIDISSYFLSVKKEIIIDTIYQLISDKEGRNLLNSLFSIQNYYYKNQLYTRYLSLMPGCAISAFFANYILTPIDNLMTSISNIYARYSDDIILFCDTQDNLNSLLDILANNLQNFGLLLNPKKIQYFEPFSEIEFLGLKIINNQIDIAGRTLPQLKAKIKKVCKTERFKIETKGKSIESAIKTAVTRFNHSFYKWGYRDEKETTAEYVFSNIETIKTLQQLDFYFKDRLKYIITGKNNKANDRLKIDYDSFNWKSFCYMYKLFKFDKDIYRNEVELL